MVTSYQVKRGANTNLSAKAKKKEIERLQRKVERASKNLHNRIVYDNIVLTVLSVTTIAVLAGWI